jgi:hypothetical protein
MCPFARPLALSSVPRKAAPGADFAELRTPKDSSSRVFLSRISSAHLDHIAFQLTPTDQAVLGFVTRTRLCSGAQLERMYWHGGEPDSRGRQARRALGQLAAWRILDRLPRTIGGRRAGSRGFLYSLGPSGVRLLARENSFYVRRLSAPGDRFVSHVLACTELVVRLHEAERAGALDLIEVQSEPTCWRPFLGPFASRRVVKPDLFVRVGAGTLEDRWMIEVDLATEATGALLRKTQRYLEHYRSGNEQRHHGVYPCVLWLVPDARRAEQIKEVMRRLPVEAGRLFTVCRFEDAIGLLATEARS